MEWLRMEQWSPYICGAGIGVLSWLTFLLSDKPLGTSTTYVKTAGMLERLFRGDRVLEREFFKSTPPSIDWQWMLVLGIVIGSFLSAMAAGHARIVWVPEPWLTAFGAATWPRVIVAFMGGAARPRLAVGGRMHQRPRHQWDDATGGGQLGGRYLLLRRRHRGRHMPLRRDCRIGVTPCWKQSGTTRARRSCLASYLASCSEYFCRRPESLATR